MKQNERLLVYAVTGFLALILVVALVFSPEPAGKNPLKSGAGGQGTGAKGLDDILGNNVSGSKVPGSKVPGSKILGSEDLASERKPDAPAPVAGADKPPENLSGLPSPKDLAAGQPLVASPKPLTSADQVLQALGPSRVEHGVRFVRVLRNDTFDGLVKRWCGARDPFLAETKALNEHVDRLIAGQEVAVPLVGDDVLLLAIEAQKPKALMPVAEGKATPAGAVDALLANADKNKVAEGVANRGTPTPAPANAGKPDFVQPSAVGSTVTKPGLDGNRALAAAAGTAYTVKDKDSLWGIAAKAYGKKNADRMIPRIKDANPGLGEALHPGQKLVLPAAEEPSKSAPTKG